MRINSDNKYAQLTKTSALSTTLNPCFQPETETGTQWQKCYDTLLFLFQVSDIVQ